MEAKPLNLDQSFADNLKNYQGQFVVIHLTSGQVLKGFVKQIKNVFLHLEKVAERNYFDAMISLNSICAIEVQVRGLKK